MNPFVLKVYQIWHISFCMKSLTRKFRKNFHKKNLVKIYAFSKQNGSLIFLPKRGAPKRKC